MTKTVVTDVLITDSENAVHFTLVSFKPAITLATDKVDINGRDLAIEVFEIVKCIIFTTNGMEVDSMSETNSDSLESGLG